MTRERAPPTALRQRSPIGGLGPFVKPQNHTSLNRGGRVPSKNSAELIVCSLTANGGDVRQFHVPVLVMCPTSSASGRGTESSNPAPSSGESANPRSYSTRTVNLVERV